MKKKALCHMSSCQRCTYKRARKAGENNLPDGINMIEPMRSTGPYGCLTHAMQADLPRVVQAETSLLLWPYQCSYFFSSCLESPSITNLYSPSLLVKMVHCLCPFVKRKVMELADFVPLSHRTHSPPSLTSLPLV